MRSETLVLGGGLLALLAVSIPSIGSDATPVVKHNKANYELASQWTPQKVGKLVFDLAVTPHWLDSGDRFWYAFENSKGRRFYLVDPVKKTKTYVFDPVKLASSADPGDRPAVRLAAPADHRDPLRQRRIDHSVRGQREARRGHSRREKAGTALTGTRETTTSIQQNQEELNEPQQQLGGRGGGRFAPPPGRDEKQLTFEYELATGKLELLDDRPLRKPTWASVSPDGQTVVYVKNRNLCMMDAANYVKAQKDANDKTIVETQITTDGVEDFALRRPRGRWRPGSAAGTAGERRQKARGRRIATPARRRTSPGRATRRSSRWCAATQRKIPKLWVINALANPRPTLETYAYAMPGEAEHAAVPARGLRGRHQDHGRSRRRRRSRTRPSRSQVDQPSARERERDKTEPLWESPGSDKLYFTRLSRDLHRLDLCVARHRDGRGEADHSGADERLHRDEAAEGDQ